MAVLASFVWVLVGCISAAVAEDPNISDLYPPFWAESPEELSDYRLEDGKHIIDPWVFTDRMGLYRILLKQTAPYFASYGPENEQNLFWGLPLQFGWQHSSGKKEPYFPIYQYIPKVRGKWHSPHIFHCCRVLCQLDIG